MSQQQDFAPGTAAEGGEKQEAVGPGPAAVVGESDPLEATHDTTTTDGEAVQQRPRRLSDADSAYDEGSFVDEDSQTLASYITDYRVEHGRRYHAYKDGSYWGPNDDHAGDVQDMAHHMYCLTLDSLHLAPIKNPHNILDVGTGTGIWAIDMADTYPGASVLGIDLSPSQPQFVPPNCMFEVDDVTSSWTFGDNRFDFVHIREMFGSVPDWDSMLHDAFCCTTPGGWIEIVEHGVWPTCDDGTMGPTHFFHEWGETVEHMGDLNGKTFRIWKEAKERVERAGFVDVVEVPYRWPMNGWPADPSYREIGRWNQLRLIDGLEGFMIRLLTDVGQWSEARAHLFLAEMRKTVMDKSTHAYLPGTVVYGRKPLQ